tara:strand:- start:95 stop:382 length:288 start_codon:yes stop_codon:yes gene_type:complete
MSKPSNINEIRIEIDKIDLKILNLLSERKDLVTQVVKFKNKDQIIDQKRINEILTKLDIEAKKRGVPQQLVRDLWKSMIKSFISYEEKIFDKTHR